MPLPWGAVRVTGIMAVLKVRAGIVPLTVMTGHSTLNRNGLWTSSGVTPA